MAPKPNDCATCAEPGKCRGSRVAASRRTVVLGGLTGAAFGARAEAPWESLPPTPVLPAPTTEGFANLGRQRLWWARFGRPTNGDPVLFLHGGLAHSAYWGLQIAALSADREVIAFDARGHGRSAEPEEPTSYAQLSADALAVMDMLSVPRAAIVGWSDGAIVGLMLAASQPARVTRLFAFGANANPSGVRPGGGRTGAFPAFVARGLAERRALSPGDRADPRRYLATMWARGPGLTAAVLSTIQAPTTIASADHDEIIVSVHASWIADQIGRARLVALHGVSHFAMLQNAAAFNASLAVNEASMPHGEVSRQSRREGRHS